jgi:hypothetical protein
MTAPPTTYLGQTVSINWTVSNASSCSASGGWSGIKSSSGGIENVTIAALNSNFTLTCTGTGGTISSTVTQTAVQPSVSLDVDQDVVRKGDTVTVNWTVVPWTAIDPAATCRIDGLTDMAFIAPSSPTSDTLNGIQPSSPITSGRSIVLSCTIFGNTYSDTQAIEVIPTAQEI